MARHLRSIVVVLLALGLGAGVWLFLRRKPSTLLEKGGISSPHLNKEAPPKPGGPASITFLEMNMSPPERQAFLAADYKTVRRVSELPEAFLGLYTVKGEKRAAMADPGEEFQLTDVISDFSLPSRRLIFAGVAQDRAFVHYEQGGICLSFIVEFFRTESPDTAVGVWRGRCNEPARSLDDLRRRIQRGDCK